MRKWQMVDREIEIDGAKQLILREEEIKTIHRAHFISTCVCVLSMSFEQMKQTAEILAWR